MTRDEYQQAVTACAISAGVLAQHGIDSAIRSIDLADSVGPIVDPSLWMKKRGAMGEDRELLLAARKLAELGRRMKEEDTP